jgi:hypothetical protein
MSARTHPSPRASGLAQPRPAAPPPATTNPTPPTGPPPETASHPVTEVIPATEVFRTTEDTPETDETPRPRSSVALQPAPEPDTEPPSAPTPATPANPDPAHTHTAPPENPGPQDSATRVSRPPAGSRKLTVNLPAGLVETTKDAYWCQRDAYPSFSAYIAHALRIQIADTRTQQSLDHIPPRPPGNFPPGRPLS